MASPAPMEIALYVGIVLIAIWVGYRLYISFSVKKEENFEDVNKSAKNVSFSMYYADWCGHCKTAKPEFAKLGSTQTIGDQVVHIKMVNPETHPDEAKGVDIRGFPTIVLKNGDKIVEYSGQRKYSDFLSFLQENVN